MDEQSDEAFDTTWVAGSLQTSGGFEKGGEQVHRKGKGGPAVEDR